MYHFYIMKSAPVKMLLISVVKKMRNETKFLVTIFILASILNITISLFVELWPLGRDPTRIHYKQALAMLDGIFPPNRTFLYNGILSVFLYFNQDYWVAQVVNAFISNLFIIPLYYIAKDQVNKKVALQSIILVSLIPFTIFGIATTPKLLAVFFILSVYYFALKNKFNTWFLVLSVLAFLTHQLALFFVQL